ncbi:hypothetical protein TNCV_1805021 [Trichonephila clavipes]|nr:hypothetical protein TNCV_1805021 [Trichonephila clavipes]
MGDKYVIRLALQDIQPHLEPKVKNIETHDDNEVPKDKTGNRSGTTSSLQTSPVSAFSFLVDVSVSEDRNLGKHLAMGTERLALHCVEELKHVNCVEFQNPHVGVVWKIGK